MKNAILRFLNLNFVTIVSLISLFYQFCSRAILENADILSDTPWRNIWKNDFWGTPLSHTGSHKSFRPLTVLSFRWNYYLDQLNPAGYHLLNVLLHSIMVGLFHLLAYTLLGSSVQSIFASLLFAVHPIHTGLKSF